MTEARRAVAGEVADTCGPARYAVQGSPRLTLRRGLVLLTAGVLLSVGGAAVASPTSVTVGMPAPSSAADDVEVSAPNAREDLGTQVARNSGNRVPLLDGPSASDPATTAPATPAPESPPATAEATTEATAEAAAPAPAPTKKTVYTTAVVNLRAAASSDSAVVKQLPASATLTAIGEGAEWQQVEVSGATGYVSTQFLTTQQPTPKKTTAAGVAAVSGGSYPACPSGSGVESGLTSRAITLHRAVCVSFPSITSFGGYRPDGEHADGRALDIMVSGASGRAVAEWARANAGALGIQTVIYEQRIWTLQRSSEGWRAMADRGSATANHYDHVHVQVS